MEKHTLEKLNRFFSKFKKISYKKGETILHADEEPRGVFYLTKGYTRIYSLSKNSQELTLIIFKPEDFYPLMWAINNTPNTYYVEAMTPVEFWQAPKEEFIKFIKNNNDVFFEITSRILTRLGGILTRMEYVMFGNAQNKVTSIILICAERFGEKRADGIFIKIPLTHQDLANLIGLTRETVSIEMKKLQRGELIDYKSKYISIRNVQKLKEESVIGI